MPGSVVFASNEGTIDRAYNYWVLGQGAESLERARELLAHADSQTTRRIYFYNIGFGETLNVLFQYIPDLQRKILYVWVGSTPAF